MRDKRTPKDVCGEATTITHKNNLVLSKIDPWGGGGGGRQVQERYKVVTFPTFLTMIVADKF